jgi:hypothetical protein
VDSGTLVNKKGVDFRFLATLAKAKNLIERTQVLGHPCHFAPSGLCHGPYVMSAQV